jgi:putative tricarboxylic transport membrane protein
LRNADRVTAVLLFVVSVAFAAGALKYYSWWTPGGPGSAFLPFWLGLVMVALSGYQFVRSFRMPAPVDWWPRGRGLRDMLVVLGATIVFVALLKTIGMVIGTALYLAFLVWFLGSHRWWVVLSVAIGAAFFNWLVFVRWLRVPFPEGVLWIF